MRRRLGQGDTRTGLLFLVPLSIGLLVFRFYGFAYNL